MSLSQRACLALLVCLPVLCWAQQNSAPAPKNAEGRIHLDVVVTDKSGKPVSGLELNDFTLLDNNLPSKILSFRAVDASVQKPEPPVEVILLLDTVNLSFQQVSIARQQVEKFLRQNGGHLGQPVSLFVLTDKGLDIQRRPTLDGNALAAQANQLDIGLRTIGPTTGAWGAIELFDLSVKAFTAVAQAEAKKPGRKLMIWVGPGWPLLDSHQLLTNFKRQQQLFASIVELSTKLREARIALYSVSPGQAYPGAFLYEDFLKGVKSPDKADPPNLGLKVFAVQSGGRVLGPDNDMAAQIGSCVKDASAFYTLSFDPLHADRANEYHDLKVQIDRPGLKARTNTGYYNQP
jgi:VWFA-related protein